MLATPILLAFALRMQEAEWRIIAGTRPDPLPIPVERVRDAYLKGRRTSIAPLAELEAHPEHHRLVIGMPAADPAIAGLAARLGVELGEDGLACLGRVLGPGHGLRLSAPDPDGAGWLVMLLAHDEAGLSSLFSVRLDLLAPGYTFTAPGTILAAGALPLFRPEELAMERALAIRLDLDFVRILDETGSWPLGERAQRLARAFAGYSDVLQRAAGAPISNEEFFAVLLRSPPQSISDTRTRFCERSMQELADRMWERTTLVLGPPTGLAPAVHFLIAPASWTNAATFDPAEPGGRPRCLINLNALSDQSALEIALAHEYAHVRHATPASGLIGRCVQEGIAVLLSQEFVPGTKDAAALMWSEDELRAAESRAAEILTRFRTAVSDSGSADLAPWTQLGVVHPNLPGTPSRLGYWVGWRAVRAWRTAHPSAPLTELFSLPPESLIHSILL